MFIQEYPYYKGKIMSGKEEKEKLSIMYEGVAYPSHSTLAFVSSLKAILSDNTF